MRVYEVEFVTVGKDMTAVKDTARYEVQRASRNWEERIRSDRKLSNCKVVAVRDVTPAPAKSVNMDCIVWVAFNEDGTFEQGSVIVARKSGTKAAMEQIAVEHPGAQFVAREPVEE